MGNMYWMLYQVLGSLGGSLGPWDGEMQWKSSFNMGKSPGGEQFHPMNPALMRVVANQVHRVHEEHVLDVVPSTEVAGTSSWPVGW